MAGPKAPRTTKDEQVSIGFNARQRRVLRSSVNLFTYIIPLLLAFAFHLLPGPLGPHFFFIVTFLNLRPLLSLSPFSCIIITSTPRFTYIALHSTMNH